MAQSKKQKPVQKPKEEGKVSTQSLPKDSPFHKPKKP